MSTLLSTDMNLKRSSTRVHAPPGGQTSISLNSWAETEKKEPPKSPSKKAHATTAAAPEVEVEGT